MGFAYAGQLLCPDSEIDFTENTAPKQARRNLWKRVLMRNGRAVYALEMLRTTICWAAFRSNLKFLRIITIIYKLSQIC